MFDEYGSCSSEGPTLRRLLRCCLNLGRKFPTKDMYNVDIGKGGKRCPVTAADTAWRQTEHVFVLLQISPAQILARKRKPYKLFFSVIYRGFLRKA